MNEIEIQANGLRFVARAAGEGPLVLLLHGFPESSWSWRHQIGPLAEAGFHAVAPDMRGYGGSDRPRPVSAYDVDVLADDIAGMIDHFGQERAIVVGHDWGGAVAWHFAHRHPDRLERLAVMNCPHPEVLLRTLSKSKAQRRKSWYMLFFQIPWLPQTLLRMNLTGLVKAAFRGGAARPERFTDEDLAEFRRALAQPGALRAGINYYRAARLGPKALRARRGIWREPLQGPVLLVWGVLDKYLGEELIEPHLERVVEGQLEIVRIPTAAHWVQQEEPELVNEALLAFVKPL